MRRLIIILSFLLVSPGLASAQFLNVGRLANVFRSVEKVFDNNSAPWIFVGTTVPAINYDQGGQGIAVSSWNPVGCGGPGNLTYRPDANLMFLDGSDGTEQFSLGCLKVGDFANYTVNFSVAGPYTITLAVANTQTGASWQILVDTQPVSSILVPNTGGFQTFQAVTSPSFNATLGNHIITLKVISVGSDLFAGNLNWLRGAQAGTGGNVAVVTLTNGPPNIPYAAAGSCAADYQHCTWIQANLPTGSPVSDVYADLVPMSSNYTGSFSLSGPGSGSFAISTNSDGTRQVGHITTNGTVGAGDYDLTVTAGSVSQRITVHAASGTSIPCGTDTTIGNAITGSGVYLLARNCTYQLSNCVVVNPNNVMLLGAGIGSTILNDQNGNLNCSIAYGGSGSPDSNTSTHGGAIANLTSQNVGALPPCLGGIPVCGGTDNGGYGNGVGGTSDTHFQVFDGWTVRNTLITGGHAANGIVAQASQGVLIANNTVRRVGGGGIADQVGWPNGVADDANPILIIGNELDTNNTDIYNACDSWTGGLGKFQPGPNGGISVLTIARNNYVHDVIGNAAWSDFNNNRIQWWSNTMLRNGAGIRTEIQSGGSKDIQFNVLRDNGNGSATTGYWCNNDNHNNSYSGAQEPFAEYFINGNNANFQNNNIVTESASGGWTDFGVTIQGGQDVGNINVSNNSVTMRAAPATNYGDFGAFESGNTGHSGTGFSNNHYHFPGGSDSGHFAFFANNYALSLSGFQGFGQDTAASGTTSDNVDGAASGCTHVACSGSGVGAGGVPQ